MSAETDKASFRQRLGSRISGDQLDPSTSTSPGERETGFPWGFAQVNKSPIGTLYALDITYAILKEMEKRYQLASRVVRMPIQDAFAADFEISITADGEDVPKGAEKANHLYQRDKVKLMKFFMLTQLYGHSELILGWNDDEQNQATTKPKEGSRFNWVQPVGVDNEVELKTTDKIPLKIEYLRVNFGTDTRAYHPSRFLHAMLPSLTEEDKIGQSVLVSIANLLETQIHVDWSIGQSLWRRAGGLLGLFAPKKNVSTTDKADALGSVTNRNSKTVVYVPNGWNVKDLQRSSGNMAIARTYKVITDQIAAGCGIPYTILMNQKATKEDRITYNKLVYEKQKNLIAPELNKYFRAAQRNGMIPAGEITISFPRLEDLTKVEKIEEEVHIGILQVLQRRLEEDANKPIEDKELSKLLSALKKK